MSLFGSMIVSNGLVTIAAMLCSIGLASAQHSGLDTRISFSGTHLTLGKAMSQIEAGSEFTFAFNPDQLDTGMPVRLNRSELTVRQALECMFSDGRFNYVVRKRFIAVSPNRTHAQRANVAAHAQESDSLTFDRYTPTDPNRMDANPGRRQIPADPDAPYEIERIVTYIPAEPVIRPYPESFSDYRPVEQYSPFSSALPVLAVKTNLLYSGLALTPNLGVEIGTSPRHSLEILGSYCWQGRKKTASEYHKQSAHWTVRPEYHWWSCERLNGHFFGAHLLFSRYYISGYAVPLLFKKQYSYDGWAAGAGLTYGYHWAVGTRWGVEFNIGVGYAYMRYDQGTCVKCDPQPVKKNHHYAGPTRAGINLVFLIR